MSSTDSMSIKQKLSFMNPETRVIIVHTTSYVIFFFSSS